MSQTDSWAVVHTYAALHEAELAAGRLQAAGIPSRVDQRDTVGLFGPGHAGRSIRGIAVLVPAGRLPAARSALDLEDAD
jgi:hypothetical protein